MEEIMSLKNYLNNFDVKIINKNKIIPERFEKDDDSNNHVFFVNICSNLRAENHRIPKADEQKTKMIARKIIPVIASTTAAITGFSFMQLFTLINNDDNSFVKKLFFRYFF